MKFENYLTVDWLTKERASLFLHRYIQLANLQSLINKSLSVLHYRFRQSLTFSSNKAFWNEVLEEQEPVMKWVELKGFQIIDWYPRAPGLFHTYHGGKARYKANQYIKEKNQTVVYLPNGKYNMIEGGIGTVRFKPIRVKGDDLSLCTATSSSSCHTGIPIAIPDYLMSKIDFNLNLKYRIIGQVKFLPDFLEKYFYHLEKIPQIYILVDEIKQMGREEGVPIKITPFVFFKGKRESIKESYLSDHALYECDNEVFYENVTYVTCYAGSLSELDRASEWMSRYISEYDGEIITNFDQQRPTFKNAPFSLQNFEKGNIEKHIIKNFFSIEHARIISDTIQSIKAEELNMSKIKVMLGDGNTFYGDFVVAKSIENSFNKATEANVSQELIDLLKHLAGAVGKMIEQLPAEDAKRAARALETLTDEATSKTPQRQWWEVSVDGLKKAATNVGKIGKPVLDIITRIIPILSTIST